MLSPEDKIRMDLITHDRNPIFQANVSKPCQLLRGPDSSDRIMRIAEEKQLNLILFYLTFKILKINMIFMILAEHQCIADDSSSVVLNHLRKRIVNRRLDQHSVSRLRICLHCHCQSKYHTRCLDQPWLLYLPVMVTLHPVSNNLKIRCLRFTVSEDSMSCTFSQCVLHIRGGLKIHIGHPEWKHILRHPAPLCKIIFQTIGVLTIYNCIKVKISFCHFFLLLFPEIPVPALRSDPRHSQFRQITGVYTP